MNQKGTTMKITALIVSFLAALAANTSAAPFPAFLLTNQTTFVNDHLTENGFGRTVAVDGNIAIVGVESGDPFASVHVFERTGSGWSRHGRLSDSRANMNGGFGYSVAVDGQTIVVGDPFQNNAAYAFVPGSGPRLNAWNITDHNNSSVTGASYVVSLSTAQYASLTTNAWRYSVTARMVHDLESGSACMYFSYGSLTNRFIFFLDFTPGGDLVAELSGASPVQYVLTTNGVRADDYHLHELEFNPATRMATYRFDGAPIKTWAGQAITTAAGVRWGAGSPTGEGSMNVHKARFDMTGTGPTLANYDAGTPASSPATLDPRNQGWSVLTAPGPSTSQEPLIPDIATIWTEQARVTASGGGASDAFGNSIDISGDTIVVGAPGRASGVGAAYVFVRQGSNWTQQAILTNTPPLANGGFGTAVAIHGNTILVGAPGQAFSFPAGRAYAFVRNGTNWTQQAAFVAPAPDNQVNNRFGASVDISGERIVIGAPWASSGGAIYVAERNSGIWSALTRLLGSPEDGDFGSSVAMDGDTMVVGVLYSLASYLFSRDGTVWVQSARRDYPNYCEDSLSDVAIDGETIVVGMLGCSGEIGLRSGVVYVQVPDFPNAGAVADYANQRLYYPAASSGTQDKDLAAFRYKHLLYGQSNGLVRARPELMPSLYGPAERQRASEAAELLLRGLSFNPDSPLLRGLLLDICYDGTVAETILSKDLITRAERVRFAPSPPNSFIIDTEIPLQRQILATNRFALQCYFDLLKRELATHTPIINKRWAAQVLGFSSEYDPSLPSYNAIQALGIPNTYPRHGDISTAWASLTPDGQREFLELAYNNPAPIDSVSIYETFNPGAVDRISVRNPETGLWQLVWSGTAASAGATARIFTVTFPLTSFPVSDVRIELNSPAVPSWNEIDAVSISGPGGFLPAGTDTQFGQRLFQTLVPGRALMAATYITNGAHVPVTANTTLFTGYKDLVLLFDLLRDYGRAANTLGRMLVGRNSPADINEAKTIMVQAQQALFLHGTLLKSMFPSLPPIGDPSGLAEAVAGWQESLNAFETLRAAIAGDINLLGFAPDFLMLVENFQGAHFDSFDSFRERLAEAGSPLDRAISLLAGARASYDTFQGYQDQLAEQFEQSAESYDSRLFQIVGARPGQGNYLDNPTNNPGSELDQQYRSIEIARLRIIKNSLEVSNVHQQVLIEVQRSADVEEATIRYGNQQASITRTIGHINASQAAMDGLADTFSAEKLLTGAVVLGLLNTAVQAGGEEAKGQLEAQKEELAAQEQAELDGIESAARVKTLLLAMSTLAVDSLEAGALLRQEVARLAALYREKADLEARAAERKTNLALRYFADPVHRLAAQYRQIEADHAFAEAQRWLFFTVRAFEYKWNSPFANYQHPPGGRIWSAASLLKLRNADELDAFYDAMVMLDSDINRAKTLRFDWFSVRDDFMGLKRTNDLGQLAMYTDPATGRSLDALSLFRTNLLRNLRFFQGGHDVVLEFNTVRQTPGQFFFVGPTFDLDGYVIPGLEGRFLDKIDYLQIRLPGNYPPQRPPQLAGNLTYGGTSFIRNPNVGHFDPLRRDRLIDEMTAYSTRYWFYDFSASQMRWRFKENLTINAIQMQLTEDPRVPPTVSAIHEFKERSVAATGWVLTIPLVQQNTEVLRIDELNDVEIYFHHYSAQRQ